MGEEENEAAWNCAAGRAALPFAARKVAA